MVNEKNGLIGSICVYLGSHDGGDPDFVKAAKSFGAILAQNGIQLVYGGTARGLMGELAQSVLAHGGHVTGITTKDFLKSEGVPKGVQMIVASHIHDRKFLMFKQADAFVAFPGGIGTLEELVEQLTWVQIGRHKKPVLIANIKRFWEPLLMMIEQMRSVKFIHSEHDVVPLIANRVEDILPILKGEMESLVSTVGIDGNVNALVKL